uniref:Uncharacterized protein n=1 Tax=Physcomitrium patens TaxID=3218 RepID=A0A2K1KIM0_PHYPA|nr:hypothetical protein PHYPA_007293 [Physcomitrium patens]
MSLGLHRVYFYFHEIGFLIHIENKHCLGVCYL